MASKQNVLCFLPFFNEGKSIENVLNKKIDRKQLLGIYEKLLVSNANNFNDYVGYKCVFISDFIEDYKGYTDISFDKFVQVGDSLGKIIANILFTLQKQYNGKIVIVSGTYRAANISLVENTFSQLDRFDVVFSSNQDGASFRILGVNKIDSEIFESFNFESRAETLSFLYKLKSENLGYYELTSGFDPCSRAELTNFLLNY